MQSNRFSQVQGMTQGSEFNNAFFSTRPVPPVRGQSTAASCEKLAQQGNGQTSNKAVGERLTGAV